MSLFSWILPQPQKLFPQKFCWDKWFVYTIKSTVSPRACGNMICCCTSALQ